MVDDRGEQWVPAKAVANPVDICGAGDSFSAGAAMALVVTGDPLQAARFGNLVAGITIMKKGTGTASPARKCWSEPRPLRERCLAYLTAPEALPEAAPCRAYSCRDGRCSSSRAPCRPGTSH